MIFEIQFRDEKLVKRTYGQSIKELGDFFGLNWKKNKPRIFLVKDRNSINKLRRQETQDWVAGWVNRGDVFILDKTNYEKESCHEYSDEGYSRLIKHELAHLFTQVYSGIFDRPIEPDWLWEGIAIYLSGQNESKKRPGQFEEFLHHYSKDTRYPGVYNESGFVVESLIRNFGKENFLNLIKRLKEINSEEGFIREFEMVYGFELNYKNFNQVAK